MKKTRSIFPLMAFALTFACVVSCDEQDEKLEAKNNTSEAKSSARITSGVDGTIGDPIDLATAQHWAANYRESNPDETLGHYFGFEIIQQILSQTDCVGIRIYYAIDDAGEKKLILVGVDSSGENLLPAPGGKVGDGGNTLADYSWPCPDYCPGNGL